MASSKSKALLAVCALVMLAAAMQAYGLRAVLQSKHPDNLSGCFRCIKTLRMSHYAEQSEDDGIGNVLLLCCSSMSGERKFSWPTQ